MEEVFFKPLLTHWPITTAVILGLIAFGWIVVRITMWMQSWKHRIKDTEDQCRKIDSEVNPRLDRIEKNVGLILMYLKGKDRKLDTGIFKSNSPIQLTEEGSRLLKLLNGKQVIEQYQDEMFAELDKLPIHTALDVQNYASIIIGTFTDKEGFNKVKDYIFSHPYFGFRDKDGKEVRLLIDLNTMSSVLGIYLRDKYLAAHPEIVPLPDTA